MFCATHDTYFVNFRFHRHQMWQIRVNTSHQQNKSFPHFLKTIFKQSPDFGINFQGRKRGQHFVIPRKKFPQPPISPKLKRGESQLFKMIFYINLRPPELEMWNFGADRQIRFKYSTSRSLDFLDPHFGVLNSLFFTSVFF